MMLSGDSQPIPTAAREQVSRYGVLPFLPWGGDTVSPRGDIAWPARWRWNSQVRVTRWCGL